MYKNIFGQSPLFNFGFRFLRSYAEQKKPEILTIDQLVSKNQFEEIAKIAVSGNNLEIELKNGEKKRFPKRNGGRPFGNAQNYGVESAKTAAVAFEIKEESGLRFWASVLLPALCLF